jgi:NodT family efflux transporter outer membrane factor (OMF) lipoprotein
MKTRRFCSIGLMVASLTLSCGCLVGPDYDAPAVSVDDSFGDATRGPEAGSIAATAPAASTTTTNSTAPATVLSSAAMGSAAWWKTLRDPLLDELITRSAAANLDVKIAASRVRQARAQLAYASGGSYPRANVGAGYSHNRLSKTAAPYNAFDLPGFPWEYNQYQAGFDAAWELDIFGGARRGAEAAGADLGASDADQQGILLSVMAEVARNYVQLRGDQQRDAIAQRNLRSQVQTLELTRDRRRQGVVTELDVARAASQVSKTEAELPLLRRRQAESIHRIAVLLGQPPEALRQMLSRPAPVPVPPPEIAIGVPAELLRRRPDIRRAERQLAGATARIGQAAADLYPRFSLTGNFATISAATNELFDWRSQSYGIGPTVTWPIFDAGRLRRVVEIRTAQQEQALDAYERTVLGALEEVHNAIVTFVTEQERHRALSAAVQSDQTAADVAQAQYRQGVIDFLDVLDAQRSLYVSEDELADSDRAVTTALVALYKSLAGGWEPTEAAHAATEPTPAPASAATVAAPAAGTHPDVQAKRSTN